MSDPGFEGGTSGWDGAAWGVTVTRDTTQHYEGVASGKVVWPGGSYYSQAMTYTFSGLTIGTSYDVSLRVKVPTGQPRSFLDHVPSGGSNSQISAVAVMFDDWVLLWGRFTATATSDQIRLINFDTTVSGNYCYIDDLRMAPTAPVVTTTNAVISSTFLPTQAPWAASMTQAQMNAQMLSMAAVGIVEVILEMTIDLDTSVAYYPTTLSGYTHGTNVVGMLLTAASAAGVSVRLGLGRTYPWESHAANTTWLNATLAKQEAIADELYSLYGGQFTGWYLPLEVEDAATHYTANQAPLASFFSSWNSYLHTHDGNLTTVVSPFFQNISGASYTQYAEEIRRILGTSDIIAQQDGAGDVARTTTFVHDLFENLSKSLAGTSAALWQNADLYDTPGNAGGPMDPSKLQSMLNAPSQFASKRTGFSFASQMDPTVSGATLTAYNAYVAYVGRQSFDFHRTLDEVLAGSHPRRLRALVTAGPAAGTELPITGGTLHLDLLGDVCAHGSLTVTGTAALEPNSPTDVLDVRSGTEILLSQGVVDDYGVTHWWDLALVRPSKPQVDTSTTVAITVDVDDRSYAVKLASIDRSWVIPNGTGILKGVQDVLAYVAPWLPTSFDLTQDISAGMDVTVADKPGVDVWQSCRGLVSSLGRVLFVDATGTAVAPVVIDPLSAAPLDVQVLVSQSVSEATADIVNRVGCPWTQPMPSSSTPGFVPAGGWEWANDTTSSTSVTSTVGPRVRVYSGDTTVIASAYHAQLAASSELINLMDLQRSATGVAMPHPYLALQSVILVDGDRYRVTGLDVDLSGAPTTLTLGRPPRSLSRLIAGAYQAMPADRDEIVTGLAPLMSRPVTLPAGSVTVVEWTDAVSGVAVGDIITVHYQGAGKRVAVALKTPKVLADTNSGNNVGTVNGQSLSVGGAVTLTYSDVGALPNTYTPPPPTIPLTSQGGSFTIAGITAGSTGSSTVYFGTSFSSTPSVSVTPGSGRLNGAITSVSSTGFTVAWNNWTAANATSNTGYYVASI